jgi:hypothetical protein
VTAKRAHFFMTPDDEREFSRRLRQELAGVRFIDGARTESPLEISSLEQASGGQAWIARPGGTAVSWKELLPMIQFLRSGRRAGEVGVLFPGRLAIELAPGDTATADFVKAVWAVLKDCATNRLMAVTHGSATGRPVRDVWLAREAASWHRDGGELAAAAAGITYRLEQ